MCFDRHVANTSPDRLVRRADAAEQLCVSPGMVRKLEQSGVLPTVYVGTAARLRQSDLDALIATAASISAEPEQEDQ